MLFMITQVHGPEACPIGAGGSDALFNGNAQGVTLKGRWGAWSHHKIWYLVEAGDLSAIQAFVDPGMKRSTCTIEPVGETSIQQ